MCTPHHQVHFALFGFARSSPSNLYQVDPRQWVESRISRSLINQYPELYWRTVFSCFETELRNDLWPNGAVATLGAFLDCHGLVPEKQHLDEDAHGGHPYRTQSRPRLLDFYAQFVEPVSIPSRNEQIYIPAHLGLPVPTRTQECRPEGPITDNFQSEESIALHWQDLIEHMVKSISDFGTRLNGQRALGHSQQIIQFRLAYYFTLYSSFRNEVARLRILVSRVQVYPQPNQPAAIAYTVESQVRSTVSHLMRNRVVLNRAYRGLFLLLSSNDKFVEYNPDSIVLRPEYIAYLKYLKVYPEGMGDWWPLPVFELDNLPLGNDALAEHPFADYPEVIKFLVYMCFLQPNATNGQLVDYFVDSMVDYEQRHSLTEERARGHDLRELSHFEAIPPGADVPQANLMPFDLVRVRDQIIWLCLIRYHLER